MNREKRIKKVAFILPSLIISVLLLGMLCTCNSCKDNNKDNEPTFEAKPVTGELNIGHPAHINWFGRTYQNDGEEGVYFNNTISGFEVRFSGTEISAEIYSSAVCYLVVYFDGVNYPEYSHRIKLEQGTQSYSLASKLSEKKLHSIKVLRSTENTEVNKTRLISLSIDGTFYEPPAKPEHKIEFYGASSISGHGSIGKSGESYSIHNSCGAHTMANYAAYRLGAQINVMSASGWGLGIGSIRSIPNVSDKYSVTDTKLWNFSLYEPEVTVMNLGYNDTKQLGTKDTPIYLQNQQLFKSKLIDFVKLIRSRHPNTYIYIVCSIYADTYEQEALTLYQEAVSEMQSEGIERIKVLPFSPMTSAEIGANYHPGWAAHKRMGKAISDNIAKELGWEIVKDID
jgi:hypothetical protein